MKHMMSLVGIGFVVLAAALGFVFKDNDFWFFIWVVGMLFLLWDWFQPSEDAELIDRKNKE